MTADEDKVQELPAKIEPASWRDLNDVRHLEKVCFPKDAWPLWDIIGVLTLPGVVRLKAEIDDQLVGFIAADVRESKDEAWIATIGVLPAYRGRGIGSALLEACEERLTVSTIKLSVRKSNTPAINMYLQEGYEKAGLWRGYYSDGEDAVVMEKRR